MLTSSIRSIGDFSSAAGEVRMQIAVTRDYGEPETPITEVEREGLRTIERLLDLGARFGERPDGSLDASGSSPDQVDLAGALTRLIPNESKEAEGFDVQTWANLAKRVLKSFEMGRSWKQFTPVEQSFITAELEPFLVQLLHVRSPEREE